ncbi:uncharacterized protein SPPG_09518 [Spizellomyces punctatus DAOM BR117]|uniref:Uncharacterized protein n=1 Tax=Spizellomyces punctatus (strain DAOM BR117) TaxID=645134 RepID=A0A0L0H4J3_SPIPD|nr:uncharacterized protein SPPG_09518 [Spizellomyces punctatus DAOM BR117]KNC96435.1 hypothetical protein SPPG_09518 [Spizellomyces punctatus DAOM BR117]|eukprot:XP_016604475.1 hypothetical protein SPPG_09518 [Spizellomyces punctatus DAOM BR117]
MKSSIFTARTRSGASHDLCRLACADRRKQLPSPLRIALDALPDGSWKADKVTVTWIVCWLSNIRPPVGDPGWQMFECSHLCLCFDGRINHRDNRIFCVSPQCLVWESKAVNQSRGNDFCLRPCLQSGCAKSLCTCQQIHDPPCR